MVRQIEVARAKKKILDADDLFRIANRNFYAEEKLDGARNKLHTHKYGNVIDSRRLSVVTGKYVDNTEKLTHLARLRLPPNWVLDGEVILETEGESINSCIKTTALLNSIPEKALELQQKYGHAVFYAFDVLFADGEDVRHLPQKDRRELLFKFMNYINSPYLKLPPACFEPEKFLEFYEGIVKSGGEGIILKDVRLPYNHARAWYKMKKYYDMDVVTTGMVEWGKGQFEGLAGSVGFGLYSSDGRLIPVGFCSGFTLQQREEVTRWYNKGLLAGRVFTIRCWGLTPKDVLRHPQFMTWRVDKAPHECTVDQLEEARNAAKSGN